MKLSNQQIDALLAVMEKKHKAKNQISNAKKIAEASKKVEKRAQELMALFEKLPAELRNWFNNYNRPTKQKMIDNLRGKVSIVEFKRSDMRDEILIASIDSATMDELKKKMRIEL